VTWLDPVHRGYVHGRRVRVLVRHIAPLLPAGGSVLDVGAGDGHVAAALMQVRSDVKIEGIDPLVRPGTMVPVREFDGRTIPSAAGAYDATLLIDVLHHAHDPLALLREATRVARSTVIVKDHRRDGLLAGPTLRFMDAVGNRRHGVALPYNYLSSDEWRAAYDELGLTPDVEVPRLGLYPWPASLLFDRSLHFVARLRKTADGQLQMPTP
jgi:SAM-dependent methyltransferase